MSHGKLWLVASVAVLGFSLLAADTQAKPRRRPGQKGGAGQMSPQMLQKFDKNGNGQLDPDEKQAAMQQRKGAGGKGAPGKPGAGKGGNPQMRQQMLQKFDKNGNGQLDPDEKQAAMQARGGKGKPKK